MELRGCFDAFSDAVNYKFSGKICNGKEKPATSITSSIITAECLPTFSTVISRLGLGGGRKDTFLDVIQGVVFKMM